MVFYLYSFLVWHRLLLKKKSPVGQLITPDHLTYFIHNISESHRHALFRISPDPPMDKGTHLTSSPFFSLAIIGRLDWFHRLKS